MPKVNRGGKRNILQLSTNNSGNNNNYVEELQYYIDINGVRRFDGVDGWKLRYNSHSQLEVEDMLWLQEEIGENLFLVPKVDAPKGNKSSDYITQSGLRIEQKKPDSPNGSIARVIEQGKGQAEVFLVNLTGTTKTKKEIDNEVQRIFYKLNSTQHAKVIYIKNGNKLVGKYIK